MDEVDHRNACLERPVDIHDRKARLQAQDVK